MLTNLPNYCRNYIGSHDGCDIKVIQELLNSTYYYPKGRPKYTHNTLRFTLIMRYTSNSAYKFLKQYLPLPSETVLTQLKSPSIQSCSALCGLRDSNLIGYDVVLLFDEMHLQQQVQYDGYTIVGCDGDLVMYKSVLCFMVVSITKSIPYVLKAITIVKL